MADPRFNRVTPELDIRSPGLRPVASGSFDFVPPARNDTFERAMKSLSGIEPEIDSIFHRLQDNKDKEEQQRGQEDALKSALEYSEAVKQGKIRPDQSPFYMKGYKEMYGQVHGQTLAIQAKTEWMNGPAKNSEAPDALDKFLSDFWQKNLASISDPDVRRGMLPIMAQTRATLAGAQAEYRGEVVKNNNLDLLGQRLGQFTDDYRSGKLDKAGWLAKVAELDKWRTLQGVSPEDFNAVVAQTAITKAREAGNGNLIGLAEDWKFIGKNHPKFAAKFAEARDAILTHQFALEERAMRYEERNRRDMGRKVLAAGYQFIIANKTLPGEADMAKIRALDPDIEIKLRSFQRQAIEDGQKEDPQETASIMSDMLRDGPGEGDHPLDVANKLAGRAKDPGTVKWLFNTAKAFQGDDMFRRPQVRDALDRIRAFSDASKTSGFGGMTGLFIDPKWTQMAEQGFTKDLIKWRMEHPKSDPLEFEDQIAKLENQWTSWATSKQGGGLAGKPDAASTPPAQPPAATPPAPNTPTSIENLSTPQLLKLLDDLKKNNGKAH